MISLKQVCQDNHECSQSRIKSIVRNEKPSRTPEGVQVEILNFISPTIIERLRQQAGIVTPQIENWRSMVDSVMIDTAYNGEVFNIVLADIPEKKTDLVSGKYILSAPNGLTTLAAKITDMLGEEVIIFEPI